jgi:hypothetical protein
MQDEVTSKHERNSKLQHCVAGHSQKLAAEETEQQVPAFMNGDENEIHPYGESPSSGTVEKEKSRKRKAR